MNAGAILEYFKPLEDWLMVRNKELDAHVGWDKSYRRFQSYMIVVMFFCTLIVLLQIVAKQQCNLYILVSIHDVA